MNSLSFSIAFLVFLMISCAGHAIEPSKVKLEQVYTQLPFQRLVYLTPVPGNLELMASVEQAGLVSIISEEKKHIILDIQNNITSNGEEGLLGLAFDPQFELPDHRFLYVYYTKPNPLRSVVSRFIVPKNLSEEVIELDTEEILLEIDQPFSNHNGGHLLFGHDGMLYIGVGDGGSGGDPFNNAQNLSTLLGKILRIDVSTKNGEGYKIPSNNPFAGSFAAKREIFSYGLRNPWRFDFIGETGKIIVGDVGQSAREEISIVESGDNMGWNFFEGEIRFNTSSLPSQFVHKGPLATLGRSQSASITGGHIHTDPNIPELNGLYLFGDFAFGRVWFLDINEENPLPEDLLTSSLISSFSKNQKNESLILDYSGKVFKIVSAINE